MSLIPTENKIIVKKIEEEEKTQTGIIIAGNPDHDKPARGEVVGVGRRLTAKGIEVSSELELGDVVHFPRYGGIEIEVDGEELIVLELQNVLVKEGK